MKLPWIILLLLLSVTLPALAEGASDIDLTGIWSCSDNGLYYLRQDGDTLWWYGESSPENTWWSHVASGTISGSTISLNWFDVPKGSNLLKGTLNLRIDSENTLTRTAETGGFGGATWTRKT